MDWLGSHPNNKGLKGVDDSERKLTDLYYFVARPHLYVFFGRARRSHVSNIGGQVINPRMTPWLHDKLKRRHIDYCVKIHNVLLPKHPKWDISECRTPNGISASVG